MPLDLSKVKRFYVRDGKKYAEMVESPLGRYVEYEELAEAEKSIAELEARPLVCECGQDEQCAQARRIIELEAELLSTEESLEAQQKKYEDCPHSKLGDPPDCGCSYDHISDVCSLHAPDLKNAQKRIAELEKELHEMTVDRNLWQNEAKGYEF